MANYIINLPSNETFVTDNEEAGKAIKAICYGDFSVSDYDDLTPEAKAVLNQFAKWNTLWVDDFGFSGRENLVVETTLFEKSRDCYYEYLGLYGEKEDEYSIEEYLKDNGCYLFEIEKA